MYSDNVEHFWSKNQKYYQNLFQNELPLKRDLHILLKNSRLTGNAGKTVFPPKFSDMLIYLLNLPSEDLNIRIHLKTRFLVSES